MAIFNRILNISVMLMAIAAAVFTWKLHERRNEMRERGDLLARTIQAAAKTLDEKTPETDQVYKTVTIGEKGAGPLGWIRFHKPDTNSDYKKSLTDFTAAVEKVRGHRDTLSGYMAKIGTQFEREIKTADLNDPFKAGVVVDELAVTLKEYYDRDKFFTEKMIANNHLVDDTYDVEFSDMRNAATYKAAQDKLTEGIDYQITQNDIKTNTLKRIADILGTERFGVSSGQMADLHPAASTTMTDHARRIRQELDRIVLLDDQIKQLKDEIVQHQAIIAEKENTIKIHEVTLATRDKQIENKDRIIARLRMRDSDPLPGTVRYDGRVIKVNYTYNYVVIDLDENETLHYGAQLTVARDREYIAKVKITKLYKQYAVAEILKDDNVGSIIEGDRVVKIRL